MLLRMGTPSALAVGVLLLASVAACGSSSDGGSDTKDAGSGGTSAGGTGTTGGAGGASGGSGGSSGAGAGPGTCDASLACAAGTFCAVYTLPPLCGGVIDPGLTNDCQVDADCADAGTSLICDAKLCDFPHGGGQPSLHCRKGCDAAADCGPGFDCDTAHHCIAASCGNATECGDNFVCTAGKCAPKPCSANQDCGDYCVNGACSATIGQCQGMVP